MMHIFPTRMFSFHVVSAPLMASFSEKEQLFWLVNLGEVNMPQSDPFSCSTPYLEGEVSTFLQQGFSLGCCHSFGEGGAVSIV